MWANIFDWQQLKAHNWNIQQAVDAYVHNISFSSTSHPTYTGSGCHAEIVGLGTLWSERCRGAEIRTLDDILRYNIGPGDQKYPAAEHLSGVIVE